MEVLHKILLKKKSAIQQKISKPMAPFYSK